MILVTLGTFPLAFDRPLVSIHEACQSGLIQSEVIVQSGHTHFESDFLEMRPFIPLQELTELTRSAELIISQAGSGSLILAVRNGKKTIAVPRLVKYDEVVDDHQLELMKVFVDEGYVLPWYETDSFPEILEQIKSFQPNEYISNKQTIIDYLEDYINSL